MSTTPNEPKMDPKKLASIRNIKSVIAIIMIELRAAGFKIEYIKDQIIKGRPFSEQIAEGDALEKIWRSEPEILNHFKHLQSLVMQLIKVEELKNDSEKTATEQAFDKAEQFYLDNRNKLKDGKEKIRHLLAEGPVEKRLNKKQLLFLLYYEEEKEAKDAFDKFVASNPDKKAALNELKKYLNEIPSLIGHAINVIADDVKPSDRKQAEPAEPRKSKVPAQQAAAQVQVQKPAGQAQAQVQKPPVQPLVPKPVNQVQQPATQAQVQKPAAQAQVQKPAAQAQAQVQAAKPKRYIPHPPPPREVAKKAPEVKTDVKAQVPQGRKDIKQEAEALASKPKPGQVQDLVAKWGQQQKLPIQTGPGAQKKTEEPKKPPSAPPSKPRKP